VSLLLEITRKSFPVQKTYFGYIKEHSFSWYDDITDDKQEETNLVTKILTFYSFQQNSSTVFKSTLCITGQTVP
jgi:hypothetical protein